MALRESIPATIGFANIEPAPESCVEGVLYDIQDECLDKLDASERYPDHYDRISVTVDTDGESHVCWTYQAQQDKTADGLVPSRNYLNHILTAKDFLSLQYFEALDQAQTYRGECACCHQTSEAIFIREGDSLSMACQPCREARLLWGDARGRRLTIAETEAVMCQLILGGDGFASVQALIAEAVRRELIEP
jgi:gamma-glutamylcyclotransferase (GGCT)/AIG2-like uncharacterized protein YtfP